ncbi:unnamed protein product [Effrenium voratum]|uniref:CSD domain-containing protein n=1 Tax=Effrenium voratum TaxID=2562239 RepID=A0AA36IV04_9DINO|nr:unnamed protein product [Effrenium voratum]
MGEPGGQSRPRRFTFSDAPNEASGASAPAAPRVVAPQAQAPAAVPPRLGFATPSQPRPQHVPAMHHSAWSQQQNWPGWGGGDGWGYEGYEGYGGDGWGGWDDPALWNACAAWHGKGGCGGYPAGSMGGQILVGTVKSYSSVKGFGFLIHSDIAQDIWFAKETVAAEYRTSDLAGTSMSFELIRAQDGKPQARNLRPAPSGMPPPPVNPNQHVPVSRFDQRPGFPPPALMRPGMPGMMPGMAGMPGMGVGVGMGVGMAMGMRPAGMPGMAAPGQPKRRAWSPHAGSRAIATASKDDQVPGMVQPPVEAKKSESEERSKSSSRRSSEPSSSSSDKKKKKKKKDKKKKKKKKKKSKKSDRCGRLRVSGPWAELRAGEFAMVQVAGPSTAFLELEKQPELLERPCFILENQQMGWSGAWEPTPTEQFKSWADRLVQEAAPALPSPERGWSLDEGVHPEEELRDLVYETGELQHLYGPQVDATTDCEGWIYATAPARRWRRCWAAAASRRSRWIPRR